MRPERHLIALLSLPLKDTATTTVYRFGISQRRNSRKVHNKNHTRQALHCEMVRAMTYIDAHRKAASSMSVVSTQCTQQGPRTDVKFLQCTPHPDFRVGV